MFAKKPRQQVMADLEALQSRFIDEYRAINEHVIESARVVKAAVEGVRCTVEDLETRIDALEADMACLKTAARKSAA